MSPSSFDSEVIELIQDFDLVSFGSPEHREHLAMLAVQGVATFEHERQLEVQRDLHYIMKGLNPRFHVFRKSQDDLFSCRQGNLF